MERRSRRNHKCRSQYPIFQRAVALTMAVIMAVALFGIQVQADDIISAQAETASDEDTAYISEEADEVIVTSDAESASAGSSDTDAASTETASDSTETAEKNMETVQNPAGETDGGSTDGAFLNGSAKNTDSTADQEEESVSANAALRESSIGNSSETGLGSENVILNQEGGAAEEAGALQGTEIDLTPYLSDETSIKISVNGAYYTLEELELKGLKVPEESPVKVSLYFKEINDLALEDLLYYQIPQDMINQVSGTMGKVYEENADGIIEKVGTYTIQKNGRIEVTLDEAYFEENKQTATGKLNLVELYIGFSGSLSADHGVSSGDGDEVISLRGDVSGNGISFKIPFEYKNENATVTVDKSSTYDPSTRMVHYTITVKAPSTNTMTADNVVVTDTFLNSASYIEKSGGSYYRNVKTYLDGTEKDYSFDLATGVWKIGELEPGQTATMTYDVQMSKKFFTQNDTDLTLDNQAELTFNNSGIDYADDSQKAPGTVMMTKSSRNSGLLQTDENGNSYLTYTVVVKAYGSRMEDIKVEDAFVKNAQAIERFEVEGTPTAGSAVCGRDSSGNATLTWNIPSLEVNESATLYYRAYVDGDAWNSATQLSTDPPTMKLELQNKAELYVKDPVTGEYEKYDEGTATSTIKKLMLSKTGSTSDSTEGIKFTIAVNGDPMTDNINYVKDEISGTTYLTSKNIQIDVYSSSSATRPEETYMAAMDSGILNAAGNSWEMNLSSVKLTSGEVISLAGQKKYFVFTYYGVNTVTQVTNGAGVGIGSENGTDREIKQSIVVSGVDFKYSKKVVDYDFSESGGYVKWQTELKSDVRKNSGYHDYMSYGCTWNDAEQDVTTYLWFTKEQIDGMELYQGSEKLVVNDDYEIIRYESSSSANTGTVDDGTWRYSGFTLKFLKDFSGLATNPITIKYTASFDPAITKQAHNRHALIFKNYGEYTFDVTATNPSYLTKVEAAVGYAPNQAGLEKYYTGYDTKTGYIYWLLKCNIQSNISTMPTADDPDYTVIEETIPADQEFVDIQVLDKKYYSQTVKSTDADYTTAINYAVTGDYAHSVKIVKDLTEIIKNDNGTTTVRVYLEGIKGWEYFRDNNLLSYKFSYGGWNNDGRFTLRVITKVPEETFLTGDYKPVYGSDNKTIVGGGMPVTNTAKIIDDDLPDGSYTATANGTVYAGSDVIQKSVATKEDGSLEVDGNIIKYMLTFNENGIDLIEGEKEVTIVDVMDEGMSLAIGYPDYFTVSVYNKSTKLWEDKTEEYLPYLQDATQVGTYAEGESPTFRIKVPDDVPIEISYWCLFDGVDGETLSLSNNAYFEYEEVVYAPTQGASKNTVSVKDSSASSSTAQKFSLYKEDQWHNPVAGATFKLYEVETELDANGEPKPILDDDGLPKLGNCLLTKTTDARGVLEFGSDDTVKLSKDKIYCYIEVSAPYGYSFDSSYRYYVQFKRRTNTGITGIRTILSGTKLSVSNEFFPASYELPVTKTINGKEISAKTEFSFTLQKRTGGSVYIDEAHKTEIPTAGIKTSIQGSGTSLFDKLYFTKAGEYTFQVTEDSLSAAAMNSGYKEKDKSVFIVTVLVEADTSDNSLRIASVTMTSDSAKKTNGSTVTNHSGTVTESNSPNFDNVADLPDITVYLRAVKTFNVERGKKIESQEFKFALIQNGVSVAETYADRNGNIRFSRTYGMEDVGKTFEYVIQEMPPEAGYDDASNPVSYNAKPITVTVEILEDGQGGLDYDITYEVQDEEFWDEDDLPLMVNEYEAEGSYVLKGEKLLQYETTSTDLTGSSTIAGTYLPVEAGEFSFTVLENGKPLATGTTLDGGAISFEPLHYVESDIGRHTYIIKEDKGNDSNQNYDAVPVTVSLEVYDIDGSGVLGVRNVTFTGGYYDSAKELMYFVNTCKYEETYTLPDTGGRGTAWYTWGGTFLIAVVPVVYCIRRRRKYCSSKTGQTETDKNGIQGKTDRE